MHPQIRWQSNSCRRPPRRLDLAQPCRHCSVTKLRQQFSFANFRCSCTPHVGHCSLAKHADTAGIRHLYDASSLVPRSALSTTRRHMRPNVDPATLVSTPWSDVADRNGTQAPPLRQHSFLGHPGSLRTRPRQGASFRKAAEGRRPRRRLTPPYPRAVPAAEPISILKRYPSPLPLWQPARRSSNLRLRKYPSRRRHGSRNSLGTNERQQAAQSSRFTPLLRPWPL